MTENIPKLRRLLNEAMERIRVLEAEKVTPSTVEVVKEVVVEVPGPERVVTVIKEIQGPEVMVYTDNPDLLETIKKLQEQICLSTSQ